MCSCFQGINVRYESAVEYYNGIRISEAIVSDMSVFQMWMCEISFKQFADKNSKHKEHFT